MDHEDMMDRLLRSVLRVKDASAIASAEAASILEVMGT